jgi:hypothetical protein
LAGAAAGAYVLTSEPPPTASPTPTETITVTAPPPTPSISPSPRDDGTDFYNAIPSAVGAYVLVATAPNTEFETARAYDSYVLTYSDGQHEIQLAAGQWRTEAAATDAFNAMSGPETWPGSDVDLSATVCPSPPDPDTKSMWRNQTVIFRVDAPDGGAAEFFCRMPM